MDPPKFDHLFVEDDLKVEGLGNKEALEILIEDVESLAKEYTRKKNTWSHIKDILNLFNQRSFVNILSAVLLLLSVVALIASNLTIFLWLILVLFGVVSVGVNAWDNYCRHYEIYYRIQYVLSQLRDCIKYEWNESSYPHLYMPFSPCINLQWTHRAGHVVNVPWSLLVRGDCILLRPGQAAPAYCVRYQPKDGHINELKFGDIYNPTRSFNPRVSKPTARSPVQNAVFVLQNTPYVRNLEGTLLQCVDKPVDYYTSSLYTLNVKCVQFILYPILFVLVILVNIFRHSYYTEWLNHISWLDLCLIQPITITLPLLPMVLPLAWFILNNYGNAVLQSSYQQEFSSNNSCLDVKKIIHKKHILNLGTWSVLKSNFISCVKGDGKFLTRTANLLHVLGSVSTICCVDKKGILSWPNPTAEKVFFLRSPNSSDLLDVREISEEPTPRLNPKENKDKIEETDNSQEQNTRPGNHGQGEGNGQRPEGCSEPGDPLHSPDRCGTLEKKRVQIVEEVKENDVKTKKSDKGFKQYRPIAEVLDLTHNKYSPFELNFDSPQWSEHLSSLKPLGLAILLNTCNKFTQAHYTQFCSHVTCQALYSDLLVPVSNRRCLCELAKQIGFAYNAAENYRLDLQLSTYRHFPAEKIRRDVKFARALQLPVQTKLKFPFPHMVAVVVEEALATSGPQLFSQGTADILLDSCVDYWNGEEVVSLSLSDRKKIQDFYQRTSLLAYCTAFAYRPLMHRIDKSLSKIYVELSPDCKKVYEYCQSPELLPSSQSTDNLFGKEKVLSDVVECFQEECNQVFIGMVTMQYQTIYDMVDLVEELDHACIRFVHFSKENELRSRVFSEKMGLESGWNCHISLSSDQNQKKNVQSDGITEYPDCKDEFLLDEKIPLLNIYPSSLSQSRGLSMSAPNTSTDDLDEVKVEGLSPGGEPLSPNDSGEGAEEEENLGEYKETYVPPHSFGSNSCLTEVTDQGEEEDGVGFDMSNRARLPRGIENIRPHLKAVDNVPLQVSLFTECNSDLTRQMLEIMQEYEQIICVVGSCANNENFPIFSQADVSIAVEPLYPQVCQRIPVLPQSNDKEEAVRFPHQIAHILNSVPCCLILNREKSIRIASYIMEARHLMQRFWSCFQYWICCITFLSVLQFISFLLFFPPILSLDGLVFLLLFIVPALSTSLVGTGFVDSKILKQATSKNHNNFNIESTIYIVWCYGLKFLVTLISCILFHFSMLSSNCHLYEAQVNATSAPTLSESSPTFACNYVYPSSSSHDWVIETSVQFKVLGSIQTLQLCLVIIHLVLISYSFVYRDYNIWTSRHYSNTLWMVTSAITFSASVLYAILVYTMGTVVMETGHVVLFCVSGLVALLVCEFIKLQEIEKNVRYQKRARLDFDTKLGMNSPF